jgi:uncharacterized protein (DUF302 family)
MTPAHVITRTSSLSVKATTDKIQTFLQQHGITIYSRIDQQAEAAKNGVTLLPLEFLLFGNPQRGGAVMAVNPLAALDLPLKIIIWEDAAHQVQVAYNEVAYIIGRYNLPQELAPLIDLDPMLTKLLS